MAYIDKEKLRMHIILYQRNPLKVILTDKEKEKFTRMLDEVPTADVVERKTAYLVNPNPYGTCSECGLLIDIRNDFNFCPNCGKDMRKEKTT